MLENYLIFNKKYEEFKYSLTVISKKLDEINKITEVKSAKFTNLYFQMENSPVENSINKDLFSRE